MVNAPAPGCPFDGWRGRTLFCQGWVSGAVWHDTASGQTEPFPFSVFENDISVLFLMITRVLPVCFAAAQQGDEPFRGAYRAAFRIDAGVLGETFGKQGLAFGVRHSVHK